MSSKLIFEAMLIETRKVGAPSLLLEDYNYFLNKAVNAYINKRYNIYDVNQQTTDDIRVLKSEAVLTPKKAYSDSTDADSKLTALHPVISELVDAQYEVTLPSDYLHLLNCTCYFKVHKNYKCFNGGSYIKRAAKRLTADSWSEIMNDYYNRPSYNLPYYYIHNVNTSNTVPTNPVQYSNSGEYLGGTDFLNIYDVDHSGNNDTNSESSYNLEDNLGSNFARVVKVKGGDGSNINISTVERATGFRYGNASNVRMEIRYGDDTIFELVQIKIDYIKAPQFIRLTQEQVDLVEDTSQILEFPDYVCQEIINELVKLVMARVSDPALQNFVPLNETIANPAQLQQQNVQSKSD